MKCCICQRPITFFSESISNLTFLRKIKFQLLCIRTTPWLSSAAPCLNHLTFCRFDSGRSWTSKTVLESQGLIFCQVNRSPAEARRPCQNLHASIRCWQICCVIANLGRMSTFRRMALPRTFPQLWPSQAVSNPHRRSLQSVSDQQEAKSPLKRHPIDWTVGIWTVGIKGLLFGF